MRFFFYGTLVHHFENAITARFGSAFGQGAEAWTAGNLIAIGTPDGWYPALVEGYGVEGDGVEGFGVGGFGRVRGRLYTARPGFGRAELALLDAYEDYRPRHRRAGEYLRRRVIVQTPLGGRALAQVYVLNRYGGGAVVPVVHGDFTRFLAETGLPAYLKS